MPVQHPARAPEHGPHRAGHLGGRRGALEQRLAEQLGAARERARAASAGPRPAGRRAAGEASKRTETMSMPDTPSTSAWWVLASRAKRSSSSPSTIQISQSGLSRSSCCENDAAGQVHAAGAPCPGRAAPWRGRGSAGSDAGRRPSAGGPGRTGRRPAAGGSAARGPAGARWPPGGRRRGEGAPSKSITDATCMCADAFSMCRNDASSPLRRSPTTAPPSATTAREARYRRAEAAARGAWPNRDEDHTRAQLCA